MSKQVEVKIIYDAYTWGPYKWHLLQQNDEGKWERCGSSMFKFPLKEGLKPHEILIHEDDGVPDPPRNSDGSLSYYRQDKANNLYYTGYIPPPNKKE